MPDALISASTDTPVALEKKFFPLPRLRAAIEHLGLYSSTQLLPALLLACKGVNSNKFIQVNKPDQFLDKFFSGELIGLPTLMGGDAFRPAFKELKGTLKSKGNLGDLALHQPTKLWANAYSSRGYREWDKSGHISRLGGADYKLTSTFQSMIDDALPDFHFEELLIWLYAFSGIPVGISSWDELFDDFKKKFCVDGLIADEFKGVFNVAGAVPWPNDFLVIRPSNDEFQEFLFPVSFVSQIGNDKWQALSEAIYNFIKAEYNGLDNLAERISKNVTAAISTERRLFILGDPGTGKSSLSKAISSAFSSTFGDDRLLIIQEEVTDETSQQSLLGFCTVSGEWINGTLTVPQNDGKKLLYQDISDKNIRSQMNLILLEEANRKDIEAYLAKFQSSLDSKNDDPKSNDHKIRLEGVGDRYLSPLTFIIMTGNSPKDDEGRIAQSRPQKRRQGLCVMPNPYSNFLETCTSDEFTENLSEFWNSFGIKRSRSTIATQSIISAFFGDKNSALTLDAVCSMWKTFAHFKIGVSYGLLEKYLRVVAQLIDLSEPPAQAFDQALVTATGPLLSNARIFNNLHIRKEILVAHNQYQQYLESFYTFVDEMVDEPDSFGQIQSFL